MEKKRDSFFLPDKKQKKVNAHKPRNPKNKRQDAFDENREVKCTKQLSEVNNVEKSEKKPFDKKTYRLKKYSKKYKLDQWEEQRKKKLIRDYQKEIKNDNVTGSYKPKSFDEDTTDSVGKYVRHPDLIEKENVAIKTKRDPFQKAKVHFNKVKEEKEQKRQEIERAKQEKQQKLQEYKKKKHEKFKKLSKKNKKGQPDMSGRLELLLEKIQKGSK